MSEDNKIEQFSINLFYTKEGEKITLLDSKNIELGSFSQQFNQEEKSFYLSDFDFPNASIPQLQEYLLFQLEAPIMAHAETIKVDVFPLKKELVDEILTFFKKDYEESFKIEKVEEHEGKCNIELTISQPRRTHYIQQAYLRNFSSNRADWLSNNNKKKARIFVFDKLNEKIINIGNTESEVKFGQKINNIAYDEYFYSLSFERFIRFTLEKDIPPILDKLLSKKSITTLTPTDKKILVKYIILTWNRPIEAREHMKEIYEKGLIKAIEMNPDLELPDNIIPIINEDFLRLQHESQIFRFLDEKKEDSDINHILNFKWILLEAKNQNFFFTSDNPIVFYNSYYEKQKSKGNDFIADLRERTLSKLKRDDRVGEGLLLTSDHPERRPRVKGVEIYFPTSPKICLLLVDFHKGFKKLKIDQINQQIILEANKFIYSHQSDFSKVTEVLKSHPEMKNKTGKRSIIKKILPEKKREGKFKFKAINPKDL